jgi:two-component system OmpR family response regulator
MARILVAESDSRVRTFIAGILADFGHEVQECADGAEASRWLAARKIDVVVTDLVLSSAEAAGLSRESSALGIPIVTLTGRLFSTGHQADADPPQALVDKPFRFADLQSVVDAVAAQAPAQPPCSRPRAA